MKNFWKRLFYAICPSAFYSRGRTASTNGVWFVNCGRSDYPKDLLDHLKDIHPQKWFDDESEALFFATYDYLTRVLKYDVKIRHRHNSDMLSATIKDKNGKEYENHESKEYGSAYLLICAYRYFNLYGHEPYHRLRFESSYGTSSHLYYIGSNGQICIR